LATDLEKQKEQPIALEFFSENGFFCFLNKNTKMSDSFNEYVSYMKRFLVREKDEFNLEYESLLRCDINDKDIKNALDSCSDVIKAATLAYEKFEIVSTSTDENNRLAIIEWVEAFDNFKIKKRIAKNAIDITIYA
jgi:hypothetical protein